MKIIHTTYNEVRGGISTPPHSTPRPISRNDPEFLTTAPASGFRATAPQRPSSPISTKTNPLCSTTRRIKRYFKLHVRSRTRPSSQRFSRSRYGTSVRYPPGKMHPPTVPTQVGKYHSGSVRGSFASREEIEDVFAVVGSQGHERGLEQRYKHAKGKKRSSYLKPREEVGGRISGGHWSGEQGLGGLDFEAYMKQQQGLERDFGKGYNGGNNSPSPPDSPQKSNSPPRDISPPKFVAREDAGDSRKMREGQTFAHVRHVRIHELILRVQLRRVRDRIIRQRQFRVPVGHTKEMEARNMSQGEGVRFSNVQWSSVGSGGSATGTTGTTDSGIHAETSRERSAGLEMGKHKAAPGQRRLRRKAKFEERDQSPAITPASSRSQTTGKDEVVSAHERREKEVQRESQEEVTTMQQLEIMRRAMWNGKLERVVPPSKEVPKHTDVLHPSTPTPTSTSSGKSRSSKGKGKGKMVERGASPIQKLKGYMGHGVEVVHDSFEKKTNSKTKLPSPFEYLLYPSYEGKRGDRSSAGSRKKSKAKDRGKEEEDSDEEFWGCIGDENHESGNLSAPHPGERVEENLLARGVGPETARKGSSGDEVWNKSWENSCKLCRKRGASGHSGLCHACEGNVLNTTAWEEHTPHFRDVGDIRPTPPLKDHQHIAHMRDMLATTPPPYNNTNYRPPLSAKDYQAPAKDLIQVSKVENSRPQIVNPSPVRQESQRLVHGGMGDSPRDIEIGFLEWQTHSLEIEGKKTEQMFRRWSETYRVEAEEAGEGSDVREDEEERVMPRDSIFYDFWGDILKGDGKPDTPKLDDRRTRE
ncbi:predicted protein [Sclerotinia sclerotiorum 1980 UF-70]|uniref:Uncharacterized protein n=1 Tax=Sclerotinia sclerotiorum (strain ATCC 18683 / 1980 / Ss-1) TaxID=665079 RepID=A7EK46_SCLS1|nr:predicted protein [Sclerotinia sclerotiorum 1980 UF-70]EDO03212.1 predicted protein [Sclerotinia sclerotiorum 1980 UF-70]